MDGKLIIFSSPSGAGKTTLVKHLLKQNLGLSFSVSATSRPMRAHETDGVDYHFMNQDTFKRKVDEGAFLEWEEVYPGLFYGTLHTEVENMLSAGRNVIFDVDVVGALNIKQAFPDSSLAVFVSPPSLDALEKRLRGRGTETEETLKQRLARARMEMEYAPRFDHIIINDDLQKALEEAESVVRSFLNIPA
ncbi:MAG: guanylate kinase [Flavobacteriales bacterium]|nr:guanylate kinase [Flavobacteriales bacterium]MCB9449398.1 guanylate kinase [Flavobacteriales bacterium]